MATGLIFDPLGAICVPTSAPGLLPAAEFAILLALDMVALIFAPKPAAKAWVAASHCESEVAPAGHVPRFPFGSGGKITPAVKLTGEYPFFCSVSSPDTKKKSLSF